MKARYIVIPLIFVLVIASSIFWWMRASNNQPQYELFEISRGDVVKTVAVSGSVVSRQKLDLGFMGLGEVETLNVEVGDQVEAGDLIATLDSSLLRQQAAAASANMSSALSMYNKTLDPLRSVDVSLLKSSLNQARVALENAEINLNDATRSRSIEVDNARASLDSAKVAYNNALNTYNASQGSMSQSVSIAKIALDNATTALNLAQSSYNSVINAFNLGQATVADLNQAKIALNNASAAYQTARVNYESAVQKSSLDKINLLAALESSRSGLNMAQSAYEIALSGVEAKYHNAKNAYESARAAYDMAVAKYNQSLAAAHPADANSSAAAVAAARASLGAIQTQISQTKLYAPIGGTITQVNLAVGELSSTGLPAVVLETANDLLIEANISEIEINEIKLGQTVKIQFDAFSDDSATLGTVVSIDPAATVVLGTINYKVTVALNNFVENLMPSMTAELEILTEQKTNVIYVPRRSVSGSGDNYTAEILTADGPKEVSIEVGLRGDSEIEVISGLSPGDQLILGEL